MVIKEVSYDDVWIWLVDDIAGDRYPDFNLDLARGWGFLFLSEPEK